jgi:hypothetical protein
MLEETDVSSLYLVISTKQEYSTLLAIIGEMEKKKKPPPKYMKSYLPKPAGKYIKSYLPKAILKYIKSYFLGSQPTGFIPHVHIHFDRPRVGIEKGRFSTLLRSRA